jgi:hypothetical protein
MYPLINFARDSFLVIGEKMNLPIHIYVRNVYMYRYD